MAIDQDGLEIELVDEFRISRPVRRELQHLLHECFPDFFETRIYAKQVPNFRILVRREGILIGQSAIDYRVMAIDGISVPVFGIVDLCVTESLRSQGIGTRILQRVEGLARECEIEFLVLFADDHRLYYERRGFTSCDCVCRWLGIDEHKSLGLLSEKLGDILMLKSMKGRIPSFQSLDLLGYLF